MKRPLLILKESLNHFRSFSSIYLGYSAWILIPTLGIVLLDLAPKSDMFGAAEFLAFLLVILGTIGIIWISIILVHLATKLESDTPIDFEAIQTTSLKQIPAILVVAGLQLLLFVGGLLMLVVPIFFFVVWYTFAQISVILDDKHGMEALVYSKKLAKGNYWSVALGMIGVPVLIALVFTTITSIIIVLVAKSTGQDILSLFSSEQEPVWITAINAIGQLFLIPISAIYTTKFYLAFKSALEEPNLVKEEQIG